MNSVARFINGLNGISHKSVGDLNSTPNGVVICKTAVEVSRTKELGVSIFSSTCAPLLLAALALRLVRGVAGVATAAIHFHGPQRRNDETKKFNGKVPLSFSFFLSFFASFFGFFFFTELLSGSKLSVALTGHLVDWL